MEKSSNKLVDLSVTFAGEIFGQFKNDAILSTGEKKYFDSVNSEIASIYDELLIEFGL